MKLHLNRGIVSGIFATLPVFLVPRVQVLLVPAIVLQRGLYSPQNRLILLIKIDFSQNGADDLENRYHCLLIGGRYIEFYLRKGALVLVAFQSAVSQWIIPVAFQLSSHCFLVLTTKVGKNGVPSMLESNVVGLVVKE